MTQPDAWTRRLKLLQLLLHRGRIATANVANALSVDRRKALGDLKALEEHGVPVSQRGEGRDTEWVLEESWRRVGMLFGLSERLSLMLGRELVQSFLAATDFGEALAKLDHQVGVLAGGGEISEGDLARRFLYVREPGKRYREHRDVVHLLTEAIVACHRISFDYRHARPPHELERFNSAAPYTLALYKRGLYVIVAKRGVISFHAVERMLNVEAHSQLTFEYPRASEYDPQAMFAERFGLAHDGRDPEQIHLRFTAEGRPYAEARQWMPEQEIITREDGGCDILFRASGLELVSRVLEYGALVEVVAPPSLRERVTGILRQALAYYATE